MIVFGKISLFASANIFEVSISSGEKLPLVLIKTIGAKTSSFSTAEICSLNTKIIPETADSEFKWIDFQERVNSELIGNFGNYANRILNVPDRYLNIVFIVLNITHVLVSMPIGALADRIGIDKGLSLTCALFVLASLYMMKSPIGGILGALIAGMLYGLFQGGYETLSRAAIPVITKEKAKGSAYAMLSLAMALGSAIGNIVIGFLWQNYGYVVALLYSAIIAIVCAILMPLTVRK